MIPTPTLRTIKSFVIRQGRMTLGQKQAVAELTQKYCLDPNHPPDWQTLILPFQSIVLEIGFGMGGALLEYARRHAQTLYLGMEVHPPGIGHVLHQIEAEALNNIRLLPGDAIFLLNSHIPDQSLNKVNVFFPDPWPKARHHKRRIVNQVFLNLIAQKLKPQGILHLATDWQNYAEWMEAVFAECPKFKLIATERGSRPLTKFEQRGLNLGHAIFDFQLQLQG